MSRVTRKEWYNRVNALWPADIRERPLTALEAIRAARKLYRFVRGKSISAHSVRLTSGNRSTDIRSGVLFVNPQGAKRDPHRGWEALVHDLSHRLINVAHGGEHARLEIRMIKEVVKRGWLNGTLRDTPKPAAPAVDPRNVKRARTVAAIARWEAKARRAENALLKLRRSLAAQDRAVTKRVTL